MSLAEEIAFESFSIFSSCGHLVHRSQFILAILVKGDKKNIFVKLLKVSHWLRNR